MPLGKFSGLVKLLGGTDGTKIGNVGDSLKVTSSDSNPIVMDPAGHMTDAFDRFRVSTPISLFDFSYRYDLYDDIIFDKQTTGLATITHDSNRVSQKLSTTVTALDEAIYQSRRYVEYNKGKSQLIYFTIKFDDPSTNLRQRAGYFDDKNGVFFEIDGTDIKFIRRSNITGSVVETSYARASWNDPMDGTGASGITLDFTKQQLFWIDFTWLGSGSIRFGTLIGNEIIIFHSINLGNVISDPWSQSGNLPMRFEMKNIGLLSLPADMYVTCGAVHSEGGERSIGQIFSASTETTSQTVTTTPSLLMAARMNPSYNRASARPLEMKLLSPTGNKEIYWRLLLNPTIVTGSWSARPQGIMQTLDSYTSFSGGVVLDEGYVEAGGETVIDFRENQIYWGRAIDGTSDIIAVEVRTPSSTASTYMSGKWREYL